MIFWVVLVFVLLVFNDLILPDFNKPLRQSMPQVMVSAIIILVVVLKVANLASRPDEAWREFKKTVGLRDLPENDSKSVYFETPQNPPD